MKNGSSHFETAVSHLGFPSTHEKFLREIFSPVWLPARAVRHRYLSFTWWLTKRHSILTFI